MVLDYHLQEANPSCFHKCICLAPLVNPAYGTAEGGYGVDNRFETDRKVIKQEGFSMLRNAAIGNMHNVPTSTTKGLPTLEGPLCNLNFIIFSTCAVFEHHVPSQLDFKWHSATH